MKKPHRPCLARISLPNGGGNAVRFQISNYKNYKHLQRTGDGSGASELAAVAAAVTAADGRGSEVRDAREVPVDGELTVYVVVETLNGSMGVGCLASGGDTLQAVASATQVALSAV